MENEKEIDLLELFKAILKKWKMVLCITLICTILSAFISFFVLTPKYEASVQLFIGKESTSSTDEAYNSNDVTMYQNLLQTYAKIIETEDVVNKAISDSKHDVTIDHVLNSLEVLPSDKTQILEIKYTDTDKYVVKEILDSITKNFIDKAQSLIPNGKVEVIESVKLPEKPISPNNFKNIAIGIILGLAIGIGIAVCMELMNNTFKAKNDLENALGIPVVGVIPDEDDFK